MKNIILLTLVLSITNVVFSQKGPGGIENTDGISDLVLWLDASNGTTADAIGLITSWNDLSGYGNNLSGTTTRTPWLRTSMVNTNNTVVFYYQLIYSSGYTENIYADLLIDDDNSLDLTEWDIFVVNRPYYNSNSNNYFTKQNGSEENYELTSNLMGSYSTELDFTDNSNNNLNSSDWTTSGSYCIMNYCYSPTDGRDVYKNNDNIISDNTNKTPKTNSSELQIGFFYGEMTEFIVFNRKLTSSERFIVTNYLAARYDITLTNNDLYSQDNNGSGDYDFDVAGIGRISGSNYHNESQGAGIVAISNPTGLEDNEFLFWGHNNAIQQADETSDIPSGVQARFSREWRFSEVSTSGTSINVGDIDISFDLSGLGSISTTDLCLLIDIDNDGNFNDESAIFGALDQGNSVYKFANVSGITNDLRFTIGTANKQQTPLPVDYISFDVKNVNNDYVNITWSTATEINSDYFEVEKSYDLELWETINTITAAGNSNSIIDYEVDDYNLNENIIYYRLKQIDFDGAFEYTDVKTVSISDNDIVGIIAYPNPFDNILNLTISTNDINSLKIFNDIGQDVTAAVTISSTKQYEISLDFTGLNSGIYFISTSNSESAIKVYKN